MKLHPAASIDTVLEFCNKVREAGGAKPLNALMPGVPADAEACLIAKNLNFECGVSYLSRCEVEDCYDYAGPDKWVMRLKDRKIRDKIAQSLNLQPCDLLDGEYAVILPRRIANVAKNFDMIAENFLGEFQRERDDLMMDGMEIEEANTVAWRKVTKGFTRTMKQYAKLAEVTEA